MFAAWGGVLSPSGVSLAAVGLGRCQITNSVDDAASGNSRSPIVVGMEEFQRMLRFGSTPKVEFHGQQ